MSFTTYIPADILKPFVRLFAISENEKAGSYKVLPDTSIVMGFQYSGKLSYSQNNEAVPLSPAGITGLRDSYRIFIKKLLKFIDDLNTKEVIYTWKYGSMEGEIDLRQILGFN